MHKLLLLLLTASLTLAGIAQAQVRTIPPNAKRATTGKPLVMPYVELSDKIVKLAPGGVIYDQNNRTIVHGALPPGTEVAVTPDMNGDVARIYILTPRELELMKQKK